MKTKKFDFFLEGHAYLESVDCKEGKPLVRIRVPSLPLDVHHFSDEVVIDCGVETLALFFLLHFLEKKRLMGQTIILKFRAKYSRFKSCFCGITPKDPEHMLTLQAQLISIEGWYQDGCWVSPDQSMIAQTIKPFLRAA